MTQFRKNTYRPFFKAVHYIIAICFLATVLLPSPALSATNIGGPANLGGGALVALSPSFIPVMLRGIKVYPDEPLKFDFIVDGGNSGLQGDALKPESEKLIRYFLASLTIPENDLWVNLSPYEKDRIVPDELGKTEMGMDMLAQDYLLKQITASLIYPEGDTGKKFWEKVYKQAYEKYGTTNIPVDTFNKVWIMPQKAVVYEQEDKAFVVESKLKVMLEEDYVALQKNSEALSVKRETQAKSDASRFTRYASRDSFTSDIVRDIVLPELEREVNSGKNFAQLRQIYNAIILGYWFKTKLKSSIVNKVYADQRKIKGIELRESSFVKRETQANAGDSRDTIHASHVDQIYQQYLNTFKNGVCNMMKVEYDPYTKKNVPRKYFAGGVVWNPTQSLTRSTSSSILSRASKVIIPLILTISLNALSPNQSQAQAIASLGKPDTLLVQNKAVSVDTVYQLSDENFLKKEYIHPLKADSLAVKEKFESSDLYRGLANKKTAQKTLLAFSKLLKEYHSQWKAIIFDGYGEGNRDLYPVEATAALRSFVNLPFFEESNTQSVSMQYDIMNKSLRAQGYLFGLSDVRSFNGKEVPFVSLWPIIKKAQREGRDIYYVKEDIFLSSDVMWSSGAGVTTAGDVFVVTPILEDLAREVYKKYIRGDILDQADRVQFQGMFFLAESEFVDVVSKMMVEEFLIHEFQHLDDIGSDAQDKIFAVSPFQNKWWAFLTRGYGNVFMPERLNTGLIRFINLESRAFLRMFLNGKLPIWNLKTVHSFFNAKFFWEKYFSTQIKPREQYQGVGHLLFPLFVRIVAAKDQARKKPFLSLPKENQNILNYFEKVGPQLFNVPVSDIQEAALLITYFLYPDMLSGAQASQAQTLLQKNPAWADIAAEAGIAAEKPSIDSNNILPEGKKRNKAGSSPLGGSLKDEESEPAVLSRKAKLGASSALIVFSNTAKDQFSISGMTPRISYQGRGSEAVSAFDALVKKDAALDKEIDRVLLVGFASHLIQNAMMHGVDKKPEGMITIYQDPLKQKPAIFEVVITQDVVDDNSWRLIMKNNDGWKIGGENYLMNVRSRKAEGAANNFGLGFYALANMLKSYPTYLEYERGEEQEGRTPMVTRAFVKVESFSVASSSSALRHIFRFIPQVKEKNLLRKLKYNYAREYPAYEDFLLEEYPGILNSFRNTPSSRKVVIEQASPEDWEEVKDDILAILFEDIMGSWEENRSKELFVSRDVFNKAWKADIETVRKAFTTPGSVIYLAKVKGKDPQSKSKIVGYIRGNPGPAGYNSYLSSIIKARLLLKFGAAQATLKDKFFLGESYVLEKYRGEGIKLFSHILSYARKSGYEYFIAFAANPKVVEFYRKIGNELFFSHLRQEHCFFIPIKSNLFGRMNGQSNGIPTAGSSIIANVPNDLKIPVQPIVLGLEEGMGYKAATVAINGTRLRLINDADRAELVKHDLTFFVNEGVLIINFLDPDGNGDVKVSVVRSQKDSTLKVTADRALTAKADALTQDFENKTFDLLTPLASSAIPSHWQKDWPVPMKEESETAEWILKNDLLNKDFPGSIFCEKARNDPYFVTGAAKFLRALYFETPNIAASLFLSFHRGNHGHWKEILNPSDAVSEEDRIESALLSAMVNRALEIYRTKEKPIFEKEGYRYLKNDLNALADLGGLFGYFPEKRSLAILADITDENLNDLILGILQFAFSRGSQFEETKDRAKNVIRSLPKERLAKVNLKYAEDRARLNEVIGKEVSRAPAAPTPTKPSVTPSHWDPAWPVPTEDQLKWADEILDESFKEFRWAEHFVLDLFNNRKKIQCERSDILRAVYFKYPNIAAALFLTSDSHGYWGFVLNPGQEEELEGLIESDLVASIMDRAFEFRGKIKNKEKIMLEKEGFYLDSMSLRDPGILDGIFGYLPEEQSVAIVSHIDDRNLFFLIAMMSNYYRNGRAGYEYKSHLLSIIENIPFDRLQKIALTLSESDRIRLEEWTEKKFSSVLALTGLSAHWQKDWPVPQQTKDEITAIIEDRAEKDFNLKGVFMTQIPGSYINIGDFRAIYYYYPDIATVIALSCDFNHGDLAEYLNDFPKDFSSRMIGWMISRAMDPVFERLDISVRGKDGNDVDIYGRRGNVSFITETLAYFAQDTDFMKNVFSMIEEKNRGQVLSLLVKNLDGIVNLGDKGLVNDVRDFLLQFPSEKIEEVRGDLSKEALGFFIQAKKVNQKAPVKEASAKPALDEKESSVDEADDTAPPSYVAKKIPQMTGTGIGKLVVFKENPYGEKDYLAIPKGSIAAFPFLAGSWTSLRGHYNGIITYYPFIRGAHAKGRAQEDSIPCALWPGPDAELMKYNGQYVKFTVTRQGVEITPSSEEAFKEFEASKAAREIKEPEIPMPKYSSLKNGPLFLAPGSAEMKNPEEVGYKPALLNIVAGHDLSVSDPDIKIEADGGAALPFRTFFKFADSRSDLAPDSMKEYFDLANTISREYAGEPKEIEAKVKAMFDSMDKAQADKFLDAIVASMKEQGQDPQEWMNNVFVRCATNIENVPDKPILGSGIFKTVANVKGREAFLKAVFEVYLSMYSDKAYWEKEDNAIPHSDVFPGVWLLKSKPVDYSLVLRWQKGEDEVDVSLAQGLGEAVMSGEGDEKGVEEAATLPTTIAFNTETAAITNDPVCSTQKMMFVLNDGSEGGTKVVPVDPAKDFLNHLERDRILNALAQLRAKVEAAADKEGILKNGFEIEAGIKFGSDGKTATITLLQVIDVNKKISSILSFDSRLSTSASSSSASPIIQGGNVQASSGLASNKTSLPGNEDQVEKEKVLRDILNLDRVDPRDLEKFDVLINMYKRLPIGATKEGLTADDIAFFKAYSEIFDSAYYKEKTRSAYSRSDWDPLVFISRTVMFILEGGITQSDKILDFGSALGFYVRALRENNYQAWGVEISPYAVSHSDPKIKEYISLLNNVSVLRHLEEQKFDTVIVKHVLEHVPPKILPRFLITLSRLAKRAFIMLPLADANGRYLNADEEQDQTHVIRKDKEWWIQLFGRNYHENDNINEMNQLHKGNGIEGTLCGFVDLNESFQSAVMSYEWSAMVNNTTVTTPRPAVDNLMDTQRMKEWVDAHTTRRSRDAAEWLSKNITHVTQKEFEMALEETVLDFNKSNQGKRYALLLPVFNGNQSEFWVYNLAKEKGMAAPSKIINFGKNGGFGYDFEALEAHTQSVVEEIYQSGIRDIVVMDDAMVFSGKRMMSYLTRLFWSGGKIHKDFAQNITLHIVAPFMTRVTQDYLLMNPKDGYQLNEVVVYKHRQIKTLDEILAAEGRSIEDLRELIGNNDDDSFKYATLTYFQHKIPDPASMPEAVARGLIYGKGGRIVKAIPFIPDTIPPYDKDYLKKMKAYKAFEAPLTKGKEKEASSGIQNSGIVEQASSSVKGGIDFNAKNMNVEIKGREASHVKRELRRGSALRAPSVALETQTTVGASRDTFHEIRETIDDIPLDAVDGFVPVIINIVPVSDFFWFLGLNENEIKEIQQARGAEPFVEQKTSEALDPQEKIKQVSFLS